MICELRFHPSTISEMSCMEFRLGDNGDALHRSCHDDKDSEETEAEGMESAVGISRKLSM